MDKRTIASSVVGLLAPLLVNPVISLAAQTPSTLSSSVVNGSTLNSSTVSHSALSPKQDNFVLSSTPQQQATYVGEGGEEPGNAKLVNAETGSSTPAWGFDKDVVNEFDPVSVNN
ncbi:hypothetical protein ACI3E1_07755, partial [Ligilactobacillus sp. LYQ139]|uniref:hypothetical protein n=1 Tax=Ligilactobacillus sp. LYQ139 TaxID=3378800 RepID=UPI0038531666